MADFESLKSDLYRSRAERAAADSAARAALEKARRLDRDVDSLGRAFDGQDSDAAQRLKKLKADAAKARRDSIKARAEGASLTAVEAAIIAQLAAFTDPSKAISRLDADTPILLMPVRLETRFKTGQQGAPELWLRIYPDDCWVDSFTPELTEAEVSNASHYWALVWAANGEEAVERGAWAELVGKHGAARASWIVKAFTPIGARPLVATPQVTLAIPTNQPLIDPERSKLLEYWQAVWRANGDLAALQSARQALDDVVGAERAAALVADYVPVNLATQTPVGSERASVALTAHFVELPVVETRQSAWSRAPQATLLPDRFIFIGYRDADDDAPLIALGNPAQSPLVVAPDPSAPDDEQIREGPDGNLIVPEPMQWLYDFDRAVAAGMGMRIPLDSAAASGFSRILVIGLRATSDATQSKAELETLLANQAHSGKGISVLAQGTPTNNSEELASGRGRFDDPDVSFDAMAKDQFTLEADPQARQDGQWLAEMLGVDPATFLHVEGAGGTDRRTAMALNTALWPATLGYWCESMMTPLFSEQTTDQLRGFFARHVAAGGLMPSLRIGWQPYGIVPATAWSRMGWLAPQRDGANDARPNFHAQLYALLRRFSDEFDGLAGRAAFVGKSGDPHQLLLDIVGLHPGSVEWTKRYAESLKSYYNRMNMAGFSGWIDALLTTLRRQNTLEVLRQFGLPPRAEPPILNLIFSGKDLALKGPVIQEGMLSETSALRTATGDGDNYLGWLAKAASSSLSELYDQDGFINDKAPNALLYILLRHALQLGYSDTGTRLYQAAGLYDAEKARVARIDEPILHVREAALVSESRYQPLLAAAPEITGVAAKPVHLHIAENLGSLLQTRPLNEQIAAIRRLESEPTARLERAFSDHVDLCSYRLDAWLMGLVDLQLARMRSPSDEDGGPARPGLYLGGYAWLEELRPEARRLSPVSIADPDLAKIFAGPSPLMRDTANQGYIHAPSLNHGVAAAILRNGFVSNSSPANPDAFAIKLTSERVRSALGLIEGIRAGQNLSDLLGYQFERGLHDRHNEAEVDGLILDLRRAFPLRADRLRSTKPPEDVSIEAIEARNVIDGLALVNQMAKPGNATYPFGKPDLPNIASGQRTIVNEEAKRLVDAHDAVADLALSEGVYQAVMGNYDRVSSTYDAYARGNFPPEPDIIRTPLSGAGLTHRLALHLDPAILAETDPAKSTPRAKAEPALNAWIAAMLPPAADVGCEVSYREAATLASKTATVTLADIGLEPIDWLWLIKGDPAQAMTELDDRIALHVLNGLGARPDTSLAIGYMNGGGRPYSFFEVSPQIRAVSAVVTRSRPLRSSDLSLTVEARTAQDKAPDFDRSRLELVETAMTNLRTDLTAHAATLTPLLADVVANRAAILSGVDAALAATTILLERATRFGIPAAGWGTLHDSRAGLFDRILSRFADYVARWDNKLLRFDAKLALADAALADLAETDPQRFLLLSAAELEITNSPRLDRPVAPADFRTHLFGTTRPAFVAKRDELDSLRLSNATTLSGLLTEADALLPISEFDVDPLTLGDIGDQVIALTQTMASIADTVLKDLAKRLDTAKAAFDAGDAAPSQAESVSALERAAKALLGDDFKIVPHFALSAGAATELTKAHSDSLAGTPFAHLAALPEPDPFPLETWLHGVARVRDHVRHWEQLLLNATALGKAEPALVPMQLPYAENDSWMGLALAPGAVLDRERLLYTAHFAAGTAPGTSQCGLLIDEWTETLPAADVDTGITFHSDRPNNEAPQAMLLVTPTTMEGQWQWADLVDALNETLAFAKRRAVEPVHLESTAYAPLLPATVMATQFAQLTISATLALNNSVVAGDA